MIGLLLFLMLVIVGYWACEKIEYNRGACRRCGHELERISHSRFFGDWYACSNEECSFVTVVDMPFIVSRVNDADIIEEELR